MSAILAPPTILPTKGHPVWEVYDELRTARLNVEYYDIRRSRTISLNNGVEYILAATASGSAIAAFSVLQTSTGQSTWAVLTALSALLAVYKPIAGLTERLGRIDAVLPGYRELEHELKMLASDIRNDEEYGSEHREKF